jgi:hypothetical protein
MQIRADVEASWVRIDAILALKREVVVIRAFGDKAEALGNESDLHWSPPSQRDKLLSDAYGRIGARCTLPNANARGH